MSDYIYKGTVLIVEDDILLALVQERMLARLGYQTVAKVESGEEAIELVKRNKPDLILMDITLKGRLDGISTMQEIRKFSDVPVIYLSGSSIDRFNYERARKTGFVDYLVKPVSQEDLGYLLDRVFTTDRSRRVG